MLLVWEAWTSSYDATRSGKAFHFGLCLRAAQFRDEISHERVVSKQFRAFSAPLAYAEGRFGLDVAVIGEDRGNDIDGA